MGALEVVLEGGGLRTVMGCPQRDEVTKQLAVSSSKGSVSWVGPTRPISCSV